MKSIKNISAAVLLVVVIIVVFQNTDTVEVRVLFASLSMSRALLLVMTLMVGVVIGLILGTRRRRPVKE